MDTISFASDFFTSSMSWLGISSSLSVMKPLALRVISSSLSLLAVNTPSLLPPLPSVFEMAKASIYLISVVIIFSILLSSLFDYVSEKLGYYKPGSFVVDVAVFESFREEWAVGVDEWSIRAQKWFNQDIDDITFCRMILSRSGLNDKTHFSPGLACFPPDISLCSARYEAELVMFGCVDQLLKKNNVKPTDIDVLVVNCSLFNPVPSLAAMIINRYKMRSDIMAYNLGGMGCSASPIAIDLARSVLKIHKKKDPLAIVISTENITQNIYLGKEKPMLLANALFRMGGAGILLSRNAAPPRGVHSARSHAKYRINDLVRVHKGNDTSAYTCVFQDVDKENKMGVRLDKNLMKVAAMTLTSNLTILAPRLLSLPLKIDYAMRLVHRKYLEYKGEKFTTPVTPKFKDSVQHIAIHAGGRAVIDAIQKAMNLSDADVKPSRDVLREKGNTSSSSIWYETVHIENIRKPKKGDLFMLLAFGSGFKVNSLILEKLVD